MPQVSPLPFTEALHMACVNTCIYMQSSCRMVCRMYSYCENYGISGFHEEFCSRGAYLSREYQSKGWTRKYIHWMFNVQ